MDLADFCKPLLFIYKLTRSNIPEDRNLNTGSSLQTPACQLCLGNIYFSQHCVNTKNISTHRVYHAEIFNFKADGKYIYHFALKQ